MVEEIRNRMKEAKRKGEDYERGVTTFYRFVLAFLLLEATQQDGFVESRLSLRDRLASLHQEIQENLSKSQERGDLSVGFQEELDFFLRFLGQVGDLAGFDLAGLDPSSP